jgi:nicotinamidase-related amidase
MPPICRGGEPGDAFQDWLEAEREVDAEATGKTFPADRASQSANLRPMPRSSQPKPNAPDTAGGSRALILVDMSCQVLPDAERLLPAARRIAAPIAALKARCRK